MKVITFVALAALLLVAVPAADARPPGGDCDLKWDDDWAMVGGTDTPLDGTTIGRPYLECYY